MTSSLAEDYLRWLIPQVRDEHRSQGRSYEGLFQLMMAKVYDERAVISNDDNRLRDGLDVRNQFQNEWGISEDWGPCTFLEVLIALSRRLEFSAGGTAQGWAWQLVCNLELHRLSDPVGPARTRTINDILDACIWRNYEPSGQGGFFPLAWPEEDQRKVELWYQMAAYTNEMHPEHR